MHFLANSVIGPSLSIQVPTKLTWKLVDTPAEIPRLNNGVFMDDSSDLGCWTAFRANSYVMPSSVTFLPYVLSNSTAYASAEILYTPNCTQYMNATNVENARTEINGTVPGDSSYSVGACVMVRIILAHHFLL